MWLSALLLALPLQQAAAPELQEFQAQAIERLLEGKSLPPDYRHQLLAMPPEDRVSAIIFLRRAGLMTGRPWTIDDLLRPAPDMTEDPK